ncbi:prolipoprotein diacylglyceryl transferase [Anaerolineae bacterium CFX7]|nr:prolipoprotein diacylglyceryl transferase [Anaerolineae bacterium CFX7]
MLPVLRLGPFTVPVAPLAWLVAFFVLQEIGERAAKRLKLTDDVFSGALTLTIGVGIVAARLGYVARYLDAFLAEPLQLVALNFGTLDLTTGALFGLIAGIAYLQRKKVSVRLFGDALAPALALGMAVLSFGNLLTGDAFGVPASNLPWTIFLWGEMRHPVQVYELIAYLLIFWFVWTCAPLACRHAYGVSSDIVRDDMRPFEGAHFLITLALIAGIRVLLEPLRGDSVPWVMGLRGAQVVAFVVMSMALLLFAISIQRPARTNKHGTESPKSSNGIFS